MKTRHDNWMGITLVLLSGVLCGEGNAEPVYGVTGSPGENSGLGYLTAPSLSPGHILRPSLIFVLPMMGTKGSQWIDFDVHRANVWNDVPDQYLIDGEWIRSTFRYSYAVRDDVSVGVALPIIGRTGGFADSAIENFHKALRLGNANRDQYPRNRSLITVNNHGVTETVVEGESWGIGDVSAFAVARLTEGTCVWPAVTVQGEVFFPTGNEDELRWMGSPAIALSSVASKRLWGSPFIAFMGVGFQYCNADDISVIRIRDEQFSGLTGVEYQYSPSLGLVVQYLLSTAVAKYYYAFAKPSHEVSAGFKWRMGANDALELAMVENVAVFQNSADIGVHLAFSRRL